MHFALPNPMWLGIAYATSEIILGMTRHSGAGTTSRDRNSLALIWIIIGISLVLARFALKMPIGQLPHPQLWVMIGIILFIGGIALRWWAILYLGRFFTIDVAIAKGHKLIDTGPYRFIRHPSYTGSILAFAGFGLTLHHWLAWLCLVVPAIAAFLWRIHVEESALADALGDSYRDYMRRTKRLIPFVY